MSSKTNKARIIISSMAISVSLCACSSRIQTPSNGLSAVGVGATPFEQQKGGGATIDNAGPGEKFDMAADEIVCKETMAAWNTALSHDKKGETADEEWKALRKKDEEESMKRLESLAQHYPKASYVKLMMGQVEQHFGKKEEAAKYYEESALQNRRDPITIFKAAEMRRQKGEMPRALRYYRQVLELSPDFPGAKVGEALCLSADKASADEGKKILNELIAKNPNDKAAQDALKQLSDK